MNNLKTQLEQYIQNEDMELPIPFDDLIELRDTMSEALKVRGKRELSQFANLQKSSNG